MNGLAFAMNRIQFQQRVEIAPISAGMACRTRFLNPPSVE